MDRKAQGGANKVFGVVEMIRAKLVSTIAHKTQIDSSEKCKVRNSYIYDRYMDFCLTCTEKRCQLDFKCKCSILDEKKERKMK